MNQQFLEILLAVMARDGHSVDSVNSARIISGSISKVSEEGWALYIENERSVSMAKEIYFLAKGEHI